MDFRVRFHMIDPALLGGSASRCTVAKHPNGEKRVLRVARGRSGVSGLARVFCYAHEVWLEADQLPDSMFNAIDFGGVTTSYVAVCCGGPSASRQNSLRTLRIRSALARCCP